MEKGGIFVKDADPCSRWARCGIDLPGQNKPVATWTAPGATAAAAAGPFQVQVVDVAAAGSGHA